MNKVPINIYQNYWEKGQLKKNQVEKQEDDREAAQEIMMYLVENL